MTLSLRRYQSQGKRRDCLLSCCRAFRPPSRTAPALPVRRAAAASRPTSWRNCLARGITVAAYGGQGQVAPAGAHNSIVISGNTVEESPAPCIRVTSTKGLLLEGNILKPAAASGTMLDPVELVNCEEVTRR